MKKLTIPERAMFKIPQNDNIYADNKVIKMADFGFSPRKGLEHGIISNGKLVNVVSDGYGHLPNQDFFLKMEQKLEAADIRYDMRTYNRDESNFAADFILNDDSFQVMVKKGHDLIKPMLRLVNSYVGGKAYGYFGHWRKICENTMHVATTKIEFGIRHSGNVIDLSDLKIDELIVKFMDNEFYSINRKFEVLAECPITNIEEFVKMTATDLEIFRFDKSDKNPEPSQHSQVVIELIEREARALQVQPNLWLGYNAFNEFIANHLTFPFEKIRKTDLQLFNYVTEMVN